MCGNLWGYVGRSGHCKEVRKEKGREILITLVVFLIIISSNISRCGKKNTKRTQNIVFVKEVRALQLRLPKRVA
jgi:hypothetical protein